MGLAGTKNKRKWAKDPNNTAWSRNTDTFGHKIMRSQGWAPGEYLGAKDASHSEFYSAANASHIRAVVKDDNMGLGAKRNQGDECTGLDALQDLLSRLNGKSEADMGEEKRKREDTKINKYLHRKLGTVRFVYGGLLVGDKVQELADALKEKDQGAAKVPGASSSVDEEGAKKEKKSSKKRKSEDGDDTKSEKKDKKSKKRKTDEADEDSKSKRKDKKDKKKSKDKDAAKEDSEGSQKDEESDEAASALKKAKKEKKEKKEKRRKSKEGGDDEKSADASDSQSKKKKKRKSESEAGGETSQPSTKASTPSGSGISTPISGAVPHRHLARSRFIAQKRAAVMDQAALNQIFMVKAS